MARSDTGLAALDSGVRRRKVAMRINSWKLKRWAVFGIGLVSFAAGSLATARLAQLRQVKADSNGVVLADGVLTAFQKGKVSVTRPLVHLLLVLGFDVYRQSPEVTINELQQKGFDLTKLFEDTWEGQAVYVIGAVKEDLKSKQLWVDKKKLLFVRLIEPYEDDPSKIEDTRF